MIDGDTVEMDRLGRVRLIGVDTPEEGRCYETAATRFTRDRLEGEVVRYELGRERRDRYDRTLAYLSKAGDMHNVALLSEGYAKVLTIPPNDKYESRFERAEREARTTDAGLWDTCDRNRIRSGGREQTRVAVRRAAVPAACPKRPVPVGGTETGATASDPGARYRELSPLVLPPRRFGDGECMGQGHRSGTTIDVAAFRAADPDCLVAAALACRVCLSGDVEWSLSVERYDAHVQCACGACGATQRVFLAPSQALRLSLHHDRPLDREPGFAPGPPGA